MKCKACGRTINEKMKFCKYCGEPILGYEESIYDTVDRKTKNRILKIAILIVSMFVLILIFVAVFYFIFADKFLSEDKDMLNKDGIQNTQIKTTEDYDQTETENETQFATDDDTVQNNINLSHIRSITASSELSEEGTVHNATQIYDGSLNHAWVEGAAGNGIEESVEIVFVDSYTLNGIKINAGYQKSQDLYYKNSRPKKIRLYFSDDSYQELELEDVFGEQDIELLYPVKTSSIKIVIESVYSGNTYEDTVISEIRFY